MPASLVARIGQDSQAVLAAFGDFFVGLSGKLGLAIPLANQAVGIGQTPCPRPDSCSEDLSVALVPGIGVDLGWFIAR